MSRLGKGPISDQAMTTITVQQLDELRRRQQVELVDVRTPEEFRGTHAAIARNVPMDTIDPYEFMRGRARRTDVPIYFICQMGGRSGQVCATFMAAGYTNVVNVAGGTDAWIDAGLPVEGV